MHIDDIPQVGAIEARAYEFPWTQQNFADSLNAGYLGVVAVAPPTTDRGAAPALAPGQDALQAYAILMPAVDDLHILNLCVAPACQGRGLGQKLLAEIRRITLALHIPTLLLEVRPSNTHAIRLYERSGFVEIGRRKNYYPARNRGREDAIVMRARLKRSDADASR
ncbi:MAG: ribosomal protein S18-alanine N-acetyltransferase [Janthinobacterium lividum]